MHADPAVAVPLQAIEIVEGDIALANVDAIVNAANTHLWMGAGVAGALKRLGGESIEREAMALGPIQIGDCVVTTAGSLGARWILHAAVMGPDLQTSNVAIVAATRSALKLANRLGARSVALPALGTGVGGFPVDECAALMLSAVRASRGKIDRVAFYLRGADAVAAFAREVRS